MRCALAVLLLACLPALGLAREPYVHEESKLRLPARLGELERIRVHRFDDARLGVAVGYALPGTGTLTLYVYDLGRKGIAEGTQSDAVREAMAGADRDIERMREAGQYVDFERLTPAFAQMDFHGGRRRLYVGAYRFRPSRGESPPLMSWLGVTGYRGHFLKIRFTYLAARDEEARAALLGFLDALFAGND